MTLRGAETVKSSFGCSPCHGRARRCAYRAAQPVPRAGKPQAWEPVLTCFDAADGGVSICHGRVYGIARLHAHLRLERRAVP